MVTIIIKIFEYFYSYYMEMENGLRKLKYHFIINGADTKVNENGFRMIYVNTCSCNMCTGILYM